MGFGIQCCDLCDSFFYYGFWVVFIFWFCYYFGQQVRSMNRFKQDYFYGLLLYYYCKLKCYICNNVEFLLYIKVMQLFSLDVF